MKLRQETKHGCTVFHIDSNLELFFADAMKKELVQEIEKNGIDKIVIDMQNVDYMDSMGISAIMQIKELADKDIKIRICNAQPSIKKLLEVTNLDKLIPVDATEDVSVKMLSGSE